MTEFEQYVVWKKRVGDSSRKQYIGSTTDLLGDKNGDTAFNKKSFFSSWLWWEPSRDSWLHEFCGSSVIHGLKYMSKRNLSAIERIFWVTSFLASLYVSWLMILQVWDRYHKSPVVVTFNPSEEETHQIPFPAVTICNKSLFRRSKIVELFKDLENGVNRERVMESLRIVNALCSSRQSFLRRMKLVKYEDFPEWEDINKLPSQRTIDEGIVRFIFDYTQNCDEFLRVCSWDQRRRNCSELFKPIITDYGKCCVFNKIPNELIKFEIDEIDGAEKRERGWTYEEINQWDKWDYESGFIIRQDGQKFPLRQKRAGNLYGLSILVDPDINDGFCESQDSEGIKLLLHTSADAPRITHQGTGYGLERETFIKVYPDSTVADESILDYDAEKRKCIFGKASILGPNTVDRPYTRNNCFLTCQQRHIRERCNCTLHYTRPGKRGYRICNPAASSHDNECVRLIEGLLAGNLRRDCSSCLYACNHLKFNVETTEATLLDPQDLWGDNGTNYAPPWANHKMSIIHIFMGSETNVPKLRQKLYGRVDLIGMFNPQSFHYKDTFNAISSIGGLLGLTLGFSVLSAIEILYLLTLRICCKRIRKRQMETSEPFDKWKVDFQNGKVMF